MQVKTTAKLRSLRMSPQKVRLIAGLIRGLSVSEALIQLNFSSKDAALPIKKLLNSAVANAINNDNAKEETLKVETITVDEGKTLYRWMPRAMGRATPLRKRSSHIKVILSGDKKEEIKKTEIKKVVKKTVKKDDSKEIKKEIKKEKKITKKEIKKNNK
jgi:large subunit ribosomal protein L22